MPVIRSAKKQMRQSLKRRVARLPLKNELKSLIKKELSFIKEGKKDEAVKLLPKVYATIDKACKKHFVHKNNAARKKSRLAIALNVLEKKGGVKVAATAEKK